MSDIVGTKFTRLTVISHADKKHKMKRYLCKCDCGNEKIIYRSSLIQGRSKSCGCLQKQLMTTHGKTNTKTFNIWYGMLRRCTDEKHHNFERYSVLGISDEWMLFENFLNDMGPQPKGMTIDRIDNNKGYSKDNCRWANVEQQANNRRDNIFITYKGVTKTISQFAHEYGIKPSTLHGRIIISAWSIERALLTPVGKATASMGIK